ncbi:MAG: aspartate 1-decarboxylase [Sedimentisphaerales bacterium]|jgi:aspartate 1-decarboxylase|nr:aspartate 1-decarboxylase [Sedimentisphaerales bacterium]
MLIKVLKSKIHKARVTDARLEYQGSIAIDQSLMEASGILPYEAVWVADLNNGNRIQTYVVPAPGGSGEVVILGPAAKLINRSDVVVIMAFAYCSPQEAAQIRPRIVFVDQANRPLDAG